MATTKSPFRWVVYLIAMALTLSCMGMDDESTGVDEDPSIINPIDGPREIDVSADNVSVREVVTAFNHLLYVSTQKIYHIKDKNAVINISIGNKSIDFDPKVNIYLFDVDVSEQEIDWWINNQYSDAHSPGIPPEPLAAYGLAEEHYSVTSYNYIGHEVGRNGDEYDSYSLEIYVDNVSEEGVFYLLGFVAETVVHVQTKEISGW